MLGIIGAMDEEVAMIKAQLTDVQVETRAAMDFYKGKLEGKEVVVVRSGIGKVNAAMCTQILADIYGVTGVVNTGIAGSLKAEIDIGDIVLSSDAVQHDMDATGFGYEPGQIPRVETLAFKADEGLIHLAEECCSKVNPDIHTFVGRVVTGDQFISDKGKKKWLTDIFGGYCTEMEGAAIAISSKLYGANFVMIKAVSDALTDGEAEYDDNFERSSKVAVKIIDDLIREI